MRERNRPSSKRKRDEKRSKGIKNTRRLGFFAWLLGTGTIEMPRIYCEEFLNLALRYGFSYYDFKLNEEGKTVRVRVPLSEKKKILIACRVWQIRAKDISSEGFPKMLSGIKGRYGLFIGAVLSLLLLLLSQSVLWRIDVSGNERIESGDIVRMLKDSGLSVGDWLFDINTDSIEQRVMINNDDISWISINITGNVASVEVREASENGIDSQKKKPANLISRFDGEIVSLEVYSGFLCVREGDFVKKGELLASGILESKHSPLRYTRASGRVYARVSRTYEIEIPLLTTEKVPTGEKIEKKTLIFFGKSIKLFTNYRNLPISCDIINYVYALNPFSLGELPISISVDTYYPFELVEIELSEEEAMDRAYEALQREIENDIPGAQILKKTIHGELIRDRYVLKCSIVALCDIARQVEFDAP